MHLLLTVGWNNPRSGKVRLVTNKNYRLVLSIVLAPKVVEDIFYSFESGAIHNGVHYDACVRFVSRQGIFNLKQTIHSMMTLKLLGKRFLQRGQASSIRQNIFIICFTTCKMFLATTVISDYEDARSTVRGSLGLNDDGLG